mgnify:CR=1 FL=1|jgi:hypothetical protein
MLIFDGLTIVDLKKTKEGSRFYQAASKRGWSDEIFPASPNNNWKTFTIQDFREHYETHFAGMTITELQKNIENGGSAFYQAIRKRGLQDEVLPRIKNNWDEFTKEDFQQYYDKHFAGMSRGKLSEDKEGGGSAYYKVVYRRGLLDAVLPRPTHNVFGDFNLEECQNYYSQHFDGMHRSRLEKHPDKEVRIFFHTVRKKGWLDNVIPRGKRRAGFYKDFANIERDVTAIIEELGRYPSKADFERVNSSLANAIISYHDGLVAVKIKMGYADENSPECNVKPNGYWQVWEKVERELEGMIKEADGNYPTSTVISKNNGGLYNAIRKYYGGHRVVKMRMGYCHDEMTVLEQLMEELAS